MINDRESERRTLRVEEIAEILGIGRTAAYSLVHRAAENNGEPFSVIRVGNVILVSKKSFNQFLERNDL